MKPYAVISAFFIMFSCAAGSKSSSASSEDITTYRPVYSANESPAKTPEKAQAKQEPPLEPKADITEELNKKLELISQNAPKMAKGYRVLLYSGNNREEATVLKEKAITLTNDKIYMEYKAPNFRVKAGNAINRLEANYLLGKLKQEFPHAVVVPDDINIIY